MTPCNRTVNRAEVEQERRQFFANQPGIVAVYLFRSVARDTAGPRSDIDVGVLDAASHIVSDQRLGEPNTNRELCWRGL